ncbi:MAG: Pr6Pr family membrane protein [Chitinophagaceae bacterium]
MKTQLSTPQKTFLAVLVLIGWFALIAQFYLYFTSKTVSLAEMTIRYFTYFTIQTNLIVAIAFTSLLFSPSSAVGRFFDKQQTRAAITVYILVVGIIYNTILRFLWAPTGMQQLVDELLHSVIPLLAFLYWLIFSRKSTLKWTQVFTWLIYPLVYVICVLLRGAHSGFYPYPFINKTLLGLTKVMVNAVGITFVFLLICLLLVGIAKFLNKKI